MRVLVLNQTFFPDLVATAQHMADLGRYMVRQGHDFDVIASRSAYLEHGALLPKYEEWEGIQVHRVGRSFFGKGTILQRALDFGFFHIAAMFKALRVRRPDVVLCLTTPPFIVTVGWMLRLVRGCRLVYLVMDLYPDVPVACGVMKRGGLLTGVLERINRFCLRRADRTVVLGRCMRERVAEKIGAAEHMRMVTPWASGEEITPLPPTENRLRAERGWNEAFVVAYCGNFGLAHDLETILKAAEELANEAGMRFAFVGGGARRGEVERWAAERKLTNVSIQDYQPRERLGELLAAADVHLISMREGIAGLIVPCKLYGIMAAGRPAVFVGPAESEVARTIEEWECGFVVRCGDVAGLVERLQWLRSNPDEAARMGRRAREALEAEHEQEACCRRLAGVLEEAVSH
jgi:glycosyltransferase involved in cell wall biosynthesis